MLGRGLPPPLALPLPPPRAAGSLARPLAPRAARAAYTDPLPKGVFILDSSYVWSKVKTQWTDESKPGPLLEEVKRKQPKVFKQWQENPETICPPEGEMLQAARDRIDFFLNKVYKKHKSGSIMVVVAEPLASLLVSVLEQSELKDISQTRNDGDARVQRISPVLTNVS